MPRFSVVNVSAQFPTDLSSANLPPLSSLQQQSSSASDLSQNPFLDQMYKEHNFDWGMGLGILNKPVYFGGDIKFPTRNQMRPVESVKGTFAYAKPWNLRYFR